MWYHRGRGAGAAAAAGAEDVEEAEEAEAAEKGEHVAVWRASCGERVVANALNGARCECVIDIPEDWPTIRVTQT